MSFVKNSRYFTNVWLCKVCEQSPAAVTCKAEADALCSSSDADIHSANPLNGRHNRTPISSFFDSPSVDSFFSSELDANKSCMSGMEDVSTCGGGRSSVAAVPVMDWEARMMRYREKRKNRRFEMTAQYASKKAYAKTRPRIKGRFAKRAEIKVEVDRIYSSAMTTFMATDLVHGVVPYF